MTASTTSPQKSTAKLYSINVLSSLCTRIVQMVVLFWVNRFLIQTVGVEEYALFPLIASLIFFINILANTCTGGVARYLIVADSKNDQEDLTRITSSMVPVLLGMATLIAGIGSLVVWQIDRVLVVDTNHVMDAQLMLGMILIYICINLVATPFAAGLYIRQRFTILNLIQLLCELVRAALLVALLLGVSQRIIWLVVANLAIEILNTSLRIAATRRMIPAIRFRVRSIRIKTAKTLLGFGAWTSTTAIGDFITKTSPILLLNRYGSPVDLAIFYLGRLPDLQLRKIIGAAITPVQPALTRLYAQEGDGVLKEAFYRGNRYCLWLALLSIGPLIVFAPNIIELYVGEAFADSAVVMSVMLARYPFFFAVAMFFRVAHASGRVSLFYRGQIVVLICTFAAMFFASWMGTGAVGVAVAMFAAESLLNVLVMWGMSLSFVKGTWKDFLRRSLLPGITPFGVACCVCVIANSWFLLDAWSTLILASFFGCGVYVGAVWLVTDSTDRELVGMAISALSTKWRQRTTALNRRNERSMQSVGELELITPDPATSK
ncbi:MAG: hypothetical protein HKN47_16600 [Pirellulaceae bacterium]|nr:hypothetical protein [Pirellulaceae bacterium]